MTKQEALQAIKDGKKVFHEYYTSDEYLWMNENGHIFTEENYDMELNVQSFGCSFRNGLMAGFFMNANGTWLSEEAEK